MFFARSVPFALTLGFRRRRRTTTVPGLRRRRWVAGLLLETVRVTGFRLRAFAVTFFRFIFGLLSLCGFVNPSVIKLAGFFFAPRFGALERVRCTADFVGLWSRIFLMVTMCFLSFALV